MASSVCCLPEFSNQDLRSDWVLGHPSMFARQRLTSLRDLGGVAERHQPVKTDKLVQESVESEAKGSYDLVIFPEPFFHARPQSKWFACGSWI